MKSFCASESHMCFWVELPRPTPNQPPEPMV